MNDNVRRWTDLLKSRREKKSGGNRTDDSVQHALRRTISLIDNDSRGAHFLEVGIRLEDNSGVGRALLRALGAGFIRQRGRNYVRE